MKRVGLVAAVLLAGCAWGQVNPQAAALLAKMRNAYGSLKSAKAVGQARFTSRTANLLVSSVVEFQPAMDFRIETTGVPGTAKPTYVCVTDGKKLHTDGLPGGPDTKAYSYNELLRSLPQANLETLCFFDWRIQLSTDDGGNMHHSKFHVLKDRWMNRDWIVLEELPDNSGQTIHYYVDPATFLIWRTASIDAGQKEPFTDFWFTKLDINPKLDPKAFAIP